jgi:coiled-coil domain-containing protein 55
VNIILQYQLLYTANLCVRIIFQKARYISNLMTTASVRGKERDRIYEKKLIKERKIEDEEYGDKPKFVTSAYKQKLIDDQKWEAEDK